MIGIDITPANLEIVRRILRDHVPGVEVRVFGSRANSTAWKFSDLDLALMTDRPLGYERIETLRDAFTESDLPYRVDVVDWANISEDFKKTIEADCVALP